MRPPAPTKFSRMLWCFSYSYLFIQFETTIKYIEIDSNENHEHIGGKVYLVVLKWRSRFYSSSWKFHKNLLLLDAATEPTTINVYNKDYRPNLSQVPSAFEECDLTQWTQNYVLEIELLAQQARNPIICYSLHAQYLVKIVSHLRCHCSPFCVYLD